MKKNAYLTICLVLILSIVCALPFAFNNDFDSAEKITYIVSKCVFGIVLIFGVLYCMIKTLPQGLTYAILFTSILVQFIPLVIRGIYSLGGGFAWAIALDALSLLVVASLFFLVSVGKFKMSERENKMEGKSIEIKQNLGATLEDKGEKNEQD